MHGCGRNTQLQCRSSEKKKKREIIANVTKEEAPLQTFKKTYLVAFFGHTHATETTLK